MNSALAAKPHCLLPCPAGPAQDICPTPPLEFTLGPNAGHQMAHGYVCLSQEKLLLGVTTRTVPELCPPCPTPTSLLVPDALREACTGGRSQLHGRLKSTAVGLCHRKGSRPEWAQRPNSVTGCGDALPLSGPRLPRHRRGPSPLRTSAGRGGGAVAPGDPPLNAQSDGTSPPLSAEHTRWRRVCGSAGADTPRPASQPPPQK